MDDAGKSGRAKGNRMSTDDFDIDHEFEGDCNTGSKPGMTFREVILMMAKKAPEQLADIICKIKEERAGAKTIPEVRAAIAQCSEAIKADNPKLCPIWPDDEDLYCHDCTCRNAMRWFIGDAVDG